ncbi:MAG: S9 family peptidase [Flavobacteriaceae bacterium TMED206]|nr:MAG: S9 family peptidase [Flavobacteriaceae bacterium TMED206]
MENRIYNITAFIILILLSGCKGKTKMNQEQEFDPPKAEIKKYQHKTHNDIRVDEFYWLNNPDNPEVIDYLERENDYYKKSTKHLKRLENKLFSEMRGRIKEDDSSVPYFYNGFWYITRYEKNKQYPIYTRKKQDLSSREEILFDCNELARGYDYFRLVGINISPDNKKVVFGIDTLSRRKYTLMVKNLVSGELLNTHIKNTTGYGVWANDNEHIFYTKKNPKTLRAESIFRQSINKGEASDKLIYMEKDSTFNTFVSKSKSDSYIFIGSFSSLTSEYQFLNASKPFDDFKLVQKRIEGLEYSVSHFENNFYIYSNANNSKNFKIDVVPISNPSKDNWKPFLPHKEQVLLEDIDLFKNFWVTTERINGLTKIFIRNWKDSNIVEIDMDGETYSTYTSTNLEFNTNYLRYVFSSMTQPRQVIQIDMNSLKKDILKEQYIEGDFEKSNYISKRIWVDSRDGKKIPVSILHKKSVEINSQTPLLLYGYGSYGSTIDPSFSSNILSLIDRGFVYAIAHIRGSEYLGRSWYDDGKMLNKKNTFFDFIDISNYLIDQNYTSSKHLYAYGGSAGGLLMGFVVNEAPDIYNGVIAAVPFVDVITTMLDESIPLTTGEFDEWGNPKDKRYYDYIKSYSPYDNVKKQTYPNLLVTSGLYDSQVQYWEPAKWVARLRLNTNNINKIYLDTNMEAGHGGSSGRFNSLKEASKKYAFLLGLENKK